MQVKITARHGHLGANEQTHIQEKAQKLLHIFERIMNIDVTVDLANEAKAVEFVVNAEHKHDLVARASNNDLHAAVDEVIDRIEGQMRRYKEKVQDHRRDVPLREAAGETAS